MKLLNKRQAAAKLGLSPSRLMGLVAEGKVPKPMKPEGRNGRALWLDSVLDDYILKLVAEQDSE